MRRSSAKKFPLLVIMLVVAAVLVVVVAMLATNEMGGAGGVMVSQSPPSDAEVIEAMKKYYRTIPVPGASIYKARRVTASFQPRSGSTSNVPPKETRYVIPVREISHYNFSGYNIHSYSVSRKLSGELEVDICSVLQPNGVHWGDPPEVVSAISTEDPIWSFRNNR